jgi:tetratricopeptide (TPR) repeat protein
MGVDLRDGALEHNQGVRPTVASIIALDVLQSLVEFVSGRQDEGVRFLETVAEKDDRWEAFADLGNYFLVRTSNGPAARDALRTAIEMGGASPIVYSRLATALVASDAPRDEVAAVAVELTGRFPEGAQSWTLAGLIYADLDQAAEAEAAYRTALEREDGEVALLPLARLLQRRRDRNAEAEQLLRRAVASETGPFRCGPSKELAELLIHQGEEAEAEGILREAVAANNRCTCCLVLQGDICRRRGALDAAEESYRAALSVDDIDIAALTGLAQLAADKEAASLVQRAIDADRDDPRVLLTRAKLGIGTLEDQKSDARMALERRPDFVEAHLFLAPLEAREGNHVLAVHHLEQALEQLPTQRELIPYFVSSAMAVAAADGGSQIGEMLRRSTHGLAVEPLSVAIRLLGGEYPLVAKEILEVAKDIVRRSVPSAER